MAIRRHELPSQFQLSLPTEGMPLRLIDISQENKLLSVLERQKLWRERPQGSIVISRFEPISCTEFDRHLNEVKRKSVDPQTIDNTPRSLPLTREKFAAIVAEIPTHFSPESLETFLKTATDRLKPRGDLFLLVQKQNGFITPDTYAQQVKKYGFVEMATITSDSTYTIIRGRRPKNRSRTAINYLQVLKNKVLPHERAILFEISEQVRKYYESEGFIVLDESESILALTHTKYPHKSLIDKKEGFGVVLQSNCGCIWHINNQGINDRIFNCSSDCDGSPPKRPPDKIITKQKTYDRLYFLEKNHVTDKSCPCGAHLVETVRVEQSYRNGTKKLRVERSCPHHGLAGNSWTVVAPDERIVTSKT